MYAFSGMTMSAAIATTMSGHVVYGMALAGLALLLWKAASVRG